MRRRFFVLKHYHLKAFTLMECLLALLVLSGSIQVYQAMTKVTSTHVRELSQPKDQDWLLFCQQFRSELAGSQLVKVSDDRLVILKNTQTLAFGKSKKEDFRKTSGDGRGFQPMIYNIESAHFRRFNQTISVQLIFKDGRVREFLYAFEKET
ncbi:competence type IV pilus minor pilin ComGF [Streptococcus pluranimalium]|uniref:competence type IV pilus minor pilin ComGF n=1 Tax=Streptococcus pluranimalium TaxID=82348 RepID=UPI0039FD45BC